MMIAKYEKIERERRWLVAALPEHLALSSPAEIEDLYLADTLIRVRKMARVNRTEYKLTKKRALPETGEHALTTIYLSEVEYRLFDSLPGRRIQKTRHYFEYASHGCAIDEFPNGQRIIEVEFISTEDLDAFEPPAFFGQEVTSEPGFTGYELAS